MGELESGKIFFNMMKVDVILLVDLGHWKGKAIVYQGVRGIILRHRKSKGFGQLHHIGGSDATSQYFINLIFNIVVLLFVFQSLSISGEGIRTLMLQGRDMMKFEVECLNISKPSIHEGVVLDIRIVNYTLYVLGINSNYKILDADDSYLYFLSGFLTPMIHIFTALRVL